MKICHRIAIIRRQIKQLAAIAERRAAEAESSRAAPGFRPLTEAEAEATLGGEFLAALAAGTGMVVETLLPHWRRN